jgi:hypothetical protein
MLTFHINSYCPKPYYRPDHSIRITKYHKEKISSPVIELRTVFGFITFAPVIPQSKQKILFLIPFFYRAQLLSYKKISQGLESCVDFRGIYPVISSLKEATLVLAPCSIVLSFRATETTLNGTRTQNILGALSFLKPFLVSRHKHAKFCKHWFIPSRAMSERTYTHTHNVSR